MGLGGLEWGKISNHRYLQSDFTAIRPYDVSNWRGLQMDLYNRAIPTCFIQIAYNTSGENPS